MLALLGRRLLGTDRWRSEGEPSSGGGLGAGRDAGAGAAGGEVERPQEQETMKPKKEISWP